MAGEDYEYGHAVAEGTWRYVKEMKPDAQLLDRRGGRSEKLILGLILHPSYRQSPIV